jgi:hypothetical protein
MIKNCYDSCVILCIGQVEWSNICLDALNSVKQLYRGKSTAEIIYSKAEQVRVGFRVGC